MSRRFLLSTLLSDLLALAFAMGIALWVVFGGFAPADWQVPAGASLLPIALLLFGGAVVGSYVSWFSWANAAPRPSYGRALAIVLIAVSVTAVGVVILRPYWSRPLFGITVAIWLALMLAHRVVRRIRPWSESMVIVTGEKQLADDIQDTEHAAVIAVLDPTCCPPEEPFDERITVVVDMRAVLSDEMAQFVSSSNLAGYRIRPLVETYEEHTDRLPIVHLTEGWEITRPVARSGYAPVKRLVDIVSVVVLAPIWLALGAIVWVVVKVGSRGPAIYAQRRVGRNEQQFTLYKFRTMVEGAESDGPQFTAVDDPRIVPGGSFLRKSRLDEIPQLWNVLRGDLTIIGPRPERVEFVEQFERSIPFYASRHIIRPGVTGWAQVKYGYADDEAETVEKLAYDLYYIKHMSFWLDLRVFGRSVWTVITGFGAK
ncbi:MAG: sugar transferase [Actinomycetota bacterium]|nr:sugar transferase [Actinomycetota bacterium]